MPLYLILCGIECQGLQFPAFILSSKSLSAALYLAAIMPDRRSLIDILREKKDGSMKRRRKYSAEFICEKPEIQKALDESFSVREIWDVLASTKRITMPYETFLRYVKHSQMAVAAVAAKSLETPKKGKKTKVPDLTNALQNAPSFELKPQKPAAFTHDPNPDPSKLI